MLNREGRLIGDLTLFRLDDQEFMIFGSGYLQTIHMRWFLEHAEAGVTIDNVSDLYCGLAISGPNAQEIVGRAAGPDIRKLPLFGARRAEVGFIPAIVGRLSITGELGYEFYVKPQHQYALYKALTTAGQDLGLRSVGLYAVGSLRLEKAYGIWSREFTPDYTPTMAGLDRFIDYDREGFIGREAALVDRASPASRRLVTLVVDATDADPVGFEPVWRKERLVGFTTSGGFGHTVGESLAMAYLDDDLAVEGAEVEVHVIGERRPARVTLSARHDPAGARLRAA
jgi:dimethylglycine dehydrogenase